MFKRSAGYRDGVDSIIGFNSVFTGSIESGGTVRVDGKLDGDLKVAGDVYIGTEATIKGNIEAENVHLAGTVEGNIVARGILKIRSTAKLYGDIKINSFVADEGALFQGKCEMLEATPLDTETEESVKKSKKSYKKSTVLEDVYEEQS